MANKSEFWGIKWFTTNGFKYVTLLLCFHIVNLIKCSFNEELKQAYMMLVE